MTSSSRIEKAETFRRLHDGPEILVLPNAWDAGSAALLAAAGFPAIATTSAGIAFAHGLPDGEHIARDTMLEAVRRIAGRVSIPVTADMEAGYGASPEAVAETVGLTIQAGAVGINIEDGTGDAANPLLAPALAAERIGAARRAADAAGVPLVINARTDGFLAGTAGDDVLADAVRRANAYRRAGADCVFVPFVTDTRIIATLVREIDGPINILAGPAGPSVPELKVLGVARVSIGGSLARAALAVVRGAAEEMRGPGTFGFAAAALPHAELQKLLAEGD